MNDPNLHQIFVASRGGQARMRIVKILSKKEQNAHELAVALGVDYSTVRHHLTALREHRIVHAGGGYGAKYSLTPEFLSLLNAYDILVDCYLTEERCTQRKWERLLRAPKAR